MFYEERDVRPGENILGSVLQNMRKALKIVIILNNEFLSCKKSLLRANYAVHEDLSRDKEDDPDCLIPVRLEKCELPEVLVLVKPLNIYDHPKNWMEILVGSIDSNAKTSQSTSKPNNDTAVNSLEAAANIFEKELKEAKIKEVHAFLLTPVALNLCHFLNQSGRSMAFHLAVETLGIQISGETVSLSMNAFRTYASRPYQIANIFRQNMGELPNELTSVTLEVSLEDDLICRETESDVKEFNELMRMVLRARSDHYLTDIMYNVEGIPKSRNIRDKCRFLIHDALVEIIPEIAAHPQFVSYDARLDSFQTWHASPPPSKEEFAEAGYFCEQNGVILLCFYCSGVDWDFKPHEDPWKRHAKWYYNCPFIRQNKTPDFIYQSRFGKSTPRRVYNLRFVRFLDRLISYQTWNHGELPHALKMADSGLYYTRLEDKVSCFYCGHGFRNWMKWDDPRYKHALLSPQCKYIRQINSTVFWQNVSRERDKMRASEKCLFTYTIKRRLAR